MNERLPFTLLSHTGSPVGYSEVAALLMRSMLEIGVEVHYACLADDYIYETKSYDLIVNEMRSIEPERKMPWVGLSTAPLLWLNGGDYKIGWTMIEVDKIGDRWARACNSCDEIWVPTPLQVDVFHECGVTVPIHVMPLGIDTQRYNTTFLPMVYHGDHKFRFFALAWWQERKRWDLLIKAFAQEFEGEPEVGLIMKIMTNTGEGASVETIHSWIGHSMDDQIAVIEGALPWWELVMMMRSCHAFCLPTGGEGWGCPPVQALACGLPTIVTDCMGPGEVLRDDKGEPFPGVCFIPCEKELTTVKHEYYTGGNWWVPDVSDIRVAMRQVYENYKHWKEEAAVGAKMVAELRSGTAMAYAVKKRLAEIYQERGW